MERRRSLRQIALSIQKSAMDKPPTGPTTNKTGTTKASANKAVSKTGTASNSRKVAAKKTANTTSSTLASSTTTAPRKRKLADPSVTSNATAPKRSAFGDITNRKTVTDSRSGKKRSKTETAGGKKRVRVSATDSSDLSISSLHSQSQSQTSNGSGVPSSQGSNLSQPKSQNVIKVVDSLSVEEQNAKNISLSQSQTSLSKRPSLKRKSEGSPSVAKKLKQESLLVAADSTTECYRKKESETVTLLTTRTEPDFLHIPAPPCATTRLSGQLKYLDIDKDNEEDIFQTPEYAQDIFNYYRHKELECMVDDYMPRQTDVTPAMRAVLVDWLVEVQENFELNHETLYLAVRLLDHYLSKHVVRKESLQLIGAAAVFIGCKFDERIPPMVDDFLYICDDAYTRPEFVKMEKEILRTVEFNLGMPISYRFLRRYAKAGRKSMPVLTLARYINEIALMSYKLVSIKESLIGASCLRLAMMMAEPTATWNDTLIHYSGYEEDELRSLVILLNNLLHEKNPTLTTVENKYSHSVFFSVARTPLLPTSCLFKELSTPPCRVTTTTTSEVVFV